MDTTHPMANLFPWDRDRADMAVGKPASAMNPFQLLHRQMGGPLVDVTTGDMWAGRVLD